MRSFLDAKAMAKTLRQELQNRKIELGHSECLEVVAKQFGFRDWNTMAAQMPDDVIVPSASTFSLPTGWSATGENTIAFNYGVSTQSGPQGENCIFISAREDLEFSQLPDVRPWIATIQSFSATAYLEKNVEFAVDVRCEEIEDQAYLWFRINNHLGQKLAYIGNGEIPSDRLFRGSQGWQTRSLVLPVAPGAAEISFGITFYGRKGRLWAANHRFETTEKSATKVFRSLSESPQNLDLQVA